MLLCVIIAIPPPDSSGLDTGHIVVVKGVLVQCNFVTSLIHVPIKQKYQVHGPLYNVVRQECYYIQTRNL